MQYNAQLGSKKLFVNDESFSFDNKVTDKPVEDDQNISDHLNTEPVSGSINFTVNRNGRAEADTLEKMRDSKQVFDYVSTTGKVYENMAIKSLSIPTDSSIKDGFQGSISLQQVQIIEQDNTQVSLGKDPVTNQQAQSKNEDTQQRTADTEEVDDSTAEGYKKAGVS